MKKLLFGGALCAMLSTGAFGGNGGLDRDQFNVVREQLCKKAIEAVQKMEVFDLCIRGADGRW